MLNIVKILYFISISTSSIYLFQSGLPQPADFVMSLAILFSFFYALIHRGDMGLGSIPNSLFFLSIWVALVGIVWAIVFSSGLFLMEPIFWVYNVLVSSMTLFILRDGKNGQGLISQAIIIALTLSALGATLALRDPMGRNAGFFNNPNQLAYFSICATACLMVLNDFRMSSTKIIVGYVLGGVGLMSSASLGAMAAATSLVLALIVANARSFVGFVSLPLGVVVIIFALVNFDNYFDSAITNTLESRIERAATKVDDLYTERNYQRIFYFPEYNFLGAGSALHEERFFPHGRHEIHSSFGALLFNYGIIGLLLFMAYLFSVVRRANIAMLLTASAPLIYSLTHMGLRFTMFWVLLAIILHKSRALSALDKP